MEFQLTDFTSVISYCGQLLKNDSFHSLFCCAARLGLEPTFFEVLDVAVTLGVPVQESTHVLYGRTHMHCTGEYIYCTGEHICTVQESTQPAQDITCTVQQTPCTGEHTYYTGEHLSFTQLTYIAKLQSGPRAA